MAALSPKTFSEVDFKCSYAAIMILSTFLPIVTKTSNHQEWSGRTFEGMGRREGEISNGERQMKRKRRQAERHGGKKTSLVFSEQEQMQMY